jgi:hypothetical protein
MLETADTFSVSADKLILAPQRLGPLHQHLMVAVTVSLLPPGLRVLRAATSGLEANRRGAVFTDALPTSLGPSGALDIRVAAATLLQERFYRNLPLVRI